MREQLLGYLLGALEPNERQSVEEELQLNPDLQRDLELLYESLEPLRAADSPISPPEGLAERTCDAVQQMERAAVHRNPAKAGPGDGPIVLTDGQPSPYAGRRTLADMTVAAGIVLAAALLLFPAIQNSRTSARLEGCRNNLRQLALAFSQYSMHNHRYLPPITPGRTAGVYAAYLQQGGYMTGEGWNLCPASTRDQRASYVQVPTLEELDAARGKLLVQLLRSMGGDYGYTLHFLGEDGQYRCVKNQARPTFAIMSDAPTAHLVGLKSTNHGGCGQNVLFEDGHVRFLSECTATGCLDHIFLNDYGRVAAGSHENDAVIGHGCSQPLQNWPTPEQRTPKQHTPEH